jgi:hypothetical protein
MKNKKINLAILLLITVLIASCKSHKSDPSPAGVNVATAPLSLHLHSYIGETEIDGYNITYMDDDNRKFSLSRAQLFISNIELVKFDGSIYPINDVILSTNIDNEVYPVANVPVGNYKSINFYVGLDSTQNAQVASGTSVLNDTSMWFNKTAQANGYVFVSCIGKIDTTAAKNAADTDLIPFVYKIGMNKQLRKVSMPVQNYTVSLNTTTFVHITMNYAQLFSGVNLLNNSNLFIQTESDNSEAIATQVANNIPAMFKYE